VNDELERIWKEVVVAKLSYYTGIFLEGRRKTPKTLQIAGVPDEIEMNTFEYKFRFYHYIGLPSLSPS
jgi:hypothetical protein